MNLEFPLYFCDFEASALRGGYPIEVAISRLSEDLQIQTAGWLIRPETNWIETMNWSMDSEHIHGVGLETLISNGQRPGSVIAEIRTFLHGSDGVVCELDLYENNWYRILMEASDEKFEVIFFSLEKLIDGMGSAKATKRIRAYLRTNPPPHRATDDAERLAKAVRSALILMPRFRRQLPFFKRLLLNFGFFQS